MLPAFNNERHRKSTLYKSRQSYSLINFKCQTLKVNMYEKTVAKLLRVAKL